MPTAVCNGAELYYERAGQGPRLLYCNGSGATLAAVRPLLAVLAGQFELLAFDYRGMGKSAAVVQPYAMADLASDVAGLLDFVGWERTALVGFSFGGMVAQEFAVTFPDRVVRLALLATSPGGHFASYPLDQLAELEPDVRAQRMMALTDRRWSTEWLAANPDQAALAATFGAAQAGEESPAQDRGRMLQLQARKAHDVIDRLDRIGCPALVGSGRYDDIAPVANGQAIADRVARADFRSYEGGHPFLLQDPSAFADLVAFLAA